MRLIMAKIANVTIVRVVKMINKVRYTSVCSLLVLISLNSFADDSWITREAHMQCGIATVKISAACQVDPEDKDSNVCKEFTMIVSQKNKTFSTKIPYMPAEQKEKLEKQKFTFSDIMDSADWAPQEMFCLDEQYILIGYWDGMNDAETIDGSLSPNVTAPIFDFNGTFVNNEKSKKLRNEINSQSHEKAYINFIYGNN